MPVYILHIEPPYRHARHYIGYTTRGVRDRVAEHIAGRGSPLVRAALDAGHEITVAHVWRCGTRLFERHLKNLKSTNRWCRLCAEHERPTPTFAAFGRKLAAGGTVRAVVYHGERDDEEAPDYEANR